MKALNSHCSLSNLGFATRCHSIGSNLGGNIMGLIPSTATEADNVEQSTAIHFHQNIRGNKQH